MSATFDTLLAIDARLVKAGHHPLTAWWKEQLHRFYSHPTARSLVARVGRGGAKSHTSVKVGLNELLNGSWRVPPGEVHYWAQVSESKPEAAERLRLYESALTGLGIDFTKAGDALIVPSLRRGVRVMACQIGAVSGFRTFGYAADEAAKWENADHSANPAAEVCASLDATSIVYPSARSLIISSPWGSEDLHAVLFARGDTSDQLTVHAESWVANPSITREICLAKSRGDERIFAREYAAIPGATVSQALDNEDVLAAFELNFTGYRSGPWCAIDASSLRGDSFAVAFGAVTPSGLAVNHIHGWGGEELRRVTMESIVKDISDACHSRGIRYVYGDQREEQGLRSLFSQQKIMFTSFAWTETSKDEAFMLLRRLLRERQLALCPNDTLRREMLACKALLRPSGKTHYATNGLDSMSAIVTLMHAALANHVPTKGPVSEAVYRPRPRLNDPLASLRGFSLRFDSPVGTLNTDPASRHLPSSQRRRMGGF